MIKEEKKEGKKRDMFDIWFYFFRFLRCEKVILPMCNFLTKNFLSIRKQKINSFGDSKKKSESFAIVRISEDEKKAHDLFQIED